MPLAVPEQPEFDWNGRILTRDRFMQLPLVVNEQGDDLLPDEDRELNFIAAPIPTTRNGYIPRYQRAAFIGSSVGGDFDEQIVEGLKEVCEENWISVRFGGGTGIVGVGALEETTEFEITHSFGASNSPPNTSPGIGVVDVPWTLRVRYGGPMITGAIEEGLERLMYHEVFQVRFFSVIASVQAVTFPNNWEDPEIIIPPEDEEEEESATFPHVYLSAFVQSVFSSITSEFVRNEISFKPSTDVISGMASYYSVGPEYFKRYDSLTVIIIQIPTIPSGASPDALRFRDVQLQEVEQTASIISSFVSSAGSVSVYRVPAEADSGTIAGSVSAEIIGAIKNFYNLD